ncbi:MAG: hypothetical protein WCK67_07790 [bacterium]
MKAAEKNVQKLSQTNKQSTNAKNKRWKVNMAAIEDYVEYMEDEQNYLM